MGIVAKAFKKLPKVKNIAQSGHTALSVPLPIVYFVNIRPLIKLILQRTVNSHIDTFAPQSSHHIHFKPKIYPWHISSHYDSLELYITIMVYKIDHKCMEMITNWFKTVYPVRARNLSKYRKILRKSLRNLMSETNVSISF